MSSSAPVRSLPALRASAAPGRARVQATVADARRSGLEWAAAIRRIRRIKIFCGLALGVLFWFSVPYTIPVVRATDKVQDAARQAEAYAGSADRQIAVPLLAAIALYGLWRMRWRGRSAGHLRFVMAAFLVWSAVSLTWSQTPAVSGKRLIVFGMDALFAFALARLASMLEIALWGFLTTGTVAILALVTDIATGEFAPFSSDYRFMGVMEANVQAMNLVVCLLCAWTLLQRRPRWTAWMLPVIGALFVLLFLTRSRMSALILLGCMTAQAVRWARRRWSPAMRAMAVVACGALVLPGLILVVGSNAGGAAQSAFMMGRNDTENTSNLSNRAPLWAELSDYAAEHPFVGYGYEGFWTPERVERISLDQGWTVPHAHNTYLDQVLSLGFVGLALFASMLFYGATIAWRRDRRERSPESLMAALLITWLALESLSESVPLDPYLPTMLAYVCLVKMCLAPGTEAEADEAVTDEHAPLLEGLASLKRLPASPAPRGSGAEVRG